MISPSPFFYSDAGTLDSVPDDGEFSVGVLETMRARGGAIPLLPGHMARLARSASPGSAVLQHVESAATLIAERTANWAQGARVRLRYGLLHGESVWDFSVVPLEPNSPWQHGVSLSLCETRVTPEASISPFPSEAMDQSAETRQGLARKAALGCKLLKRDIYTRAEAELEQHVAGLEPGLFHEGVLLDAQGRVIEGLRSNLLVYRGGRWTTPSLRNCGVRGVMLDWLAARVEISEDDLLIPDLEQAEELAVCNAVRGVVPVIQLMLDSSGEDGARTLVPGSAVAALQALVATELH
ncbi:aminotransferase class IV [Microbulbifer sp. YPW1]|uniref:aminotransferase class IV n=1 Tax=Microbulbifer sp. YPW1 TaxID=2745199 RepID=UPI00159B5588|nr:aminotransferase class IV [Microbulbifer sp. YPW1]QKX18358.1 aminotransferase class IV [Microbulbifer sp. YPW1]